MEKGATTAGKLLRVPSRRTGESPISYLARVAEAQGYPHHLWMFELAGGKAAGTRSLARRRDALAAFLGVDPEDLLPLGGAGARGGGTSEAKVGGAWLPLGYLDLEGPRLCPPCLLRQGVRHSLWDIKAFSCCPEHHVRLLESCRECKRAPRVSVNGLLNCACGADLTRMQAKPASESEVALHQWLAYLAGFAPRPTDMRFEALADHLGQLTLKDLIDLAVVFGWHSDGRDPLSLLPQRKAADWAEPVRKGVELLANWPEGLCAAIEAKLSSEFDAFLRHRESLSKFYAASAGRFREQKFDFLRAALNQMESAQWSDFASRFRRSLPEPVGRRNATAIGARSLAKDLGLTEHEVIQLGRARVLPTVTQQESGGRLDWLFAPDLAEEVFRDLDRHALPVADESFSIGLPLYKARQLPGSSLLVADLVEQARKGTIPVLAGVSRARGLKDCFFSYRHLLKAASPQLNCSAGTVATSTACGYLGTTRQGWDWLCRKGWLRKALHTEVGPELSAPQFWQLADMIIVPGNVIFGPRTGLRHGKAGLDQIGAVPFASAKNGSPAVLYWRRDVERKLATYLATRLSSLSF